jgi:nitroimidazol reductase NimA-like FMN-containing flavoprotein (pyridoxamine 5'-phosphate oxidase superfamily)
MFETNAELERMDELMRRSIERASAFLRSSFEMPEHSLSARQLAGHLQGSLTVALATVTARGEPRVAPINAVFVGGRFHVPTLAEAARARHLSRRPAASLTYYEGNDLAVIVHGQVQFIAADDPGFAAIDAAQVQSGRESPSEWGGHPVYLRLEPETLYTYARHPERIAGGDERA